MKEKIIIIASMFLTLCESVNAHVIENDFYNYKISVNDSCAVKYLKEDSSMVSIASPDGASIFYLICINTGDYEKVYKNKLLETFDSDMFESLKQEPDNKETYFWLSKEDHFYKLKDGSICKTRALLWNDKAGLLVGFSKEDDTAFIDKCMNDFKSPLSLGQVATLIYVFVLMCLFIVVFVLWEDKKTLAIILILIIVVGWYYFHWVLDFSVNRFIMNALG